MGEKYSNVTLYVQPVNEPLTLLNSLGNIEIMDTNDNPYKEAIIGFNHNQEYGFTGNIRLSIRQQILIMGFWNTLKSLFRKRRC